MSYKEVQIKGNYRIQSSTLIKIQTHEKKLNDKPNEASLRGRMLSHNLFSISK
jgi:hypothetical protein